VKKAQIALSDSAVADILDQADWYEGQSDRKLAMRWEKAVTSSLLRIGSNPRSGAACSFRAEELRDVRRAPVAGFSKHLIFYRFQEKEVLVLRVVHGARDLESLF
jgi:toxin ParE1/3/4